MPHKAVFFNLEPWAQEYLQNNQALAGAGVEVGFVNGIIDKNHPAPDKISIFWERSLIRRRMRRSLRPLPNLKHIATLSTGYDHIDLAACAARGHHGFLCADLWREHGRGICVRPDARAFAENLRSERTRENGRQFSVGWSAGVRSDGKDARRFGDGPYRPACGSHGERVWHERDRVRCVSEPALAAQLGFEYKPLDGGSRAKRYRDRPCAVSAVHAPFDQRRKYRAHETRRVSYQYRARRVSWTPMRS